MTLNMQPPKTVRYTRTVGKSSGQRYFVIETQTVITLDYNLLIIMELIIIQEVHVFLKEKQKASFWVDREGKCKPPLQLYYYILALNRFTNICFHTAIKQVIMDTVI